MNTPILYTDTKTNWQIKIYDKTDRSARFHKNLNKLNLNKTFKNCQFLDCSEVIRINRTSGLCDLHLKHQHSLFLELIDPTSTTSTPPMHTTIIDGLYQWALTRNYDLKPFFESISFNILGNIPDVTTLANEVSHVGYTPPILNDLLYESYHLVDKFFPQTNNASFQVVKIKAVNYPIRILALTLVGLIVCEEANRGDRWYNRNILNMERKTEMLGGAMPIGYFAAISFNWGIEFGKAKTNFVPR